MSKLLLLREKQEKGAHYFRLALRCAFHSFFAPRARGNQPERVDLLFWLS